MTDTTDFDFDFDVDDDAAPKGSRSGSEANGSTPSPPNGSTGSNGSDRSRSKLPPLVYEDGDQKRDEDG